MGLLDKKYLKLLHKYAFLIGGEWSVEVVSVGQKEMPIAETVSSVVIKDGEKKLRFFVSNDVAWDRWWHDLEISAIHELLHVVMVESGLDGEVARLVEDVKRVAPQVALAHESGIKDAEEKLLDRVAIALKEAYGKASRR